MKVSKTIILTAGIISIFLLVFLFQNPKLLSTTSTDELFSAFHEPVVGVFELNNSRQGGLFAHYALKIDQHVDEARMDKLLGAIPNADQLIITIFMPGTGYTSAPNALETVSDGEYDAKLRSLCRVLAKRPGAIYLRWNPEMEVPVQLYPWQYQSPNDYIKAFNHVSQLCKAAFPAVKIVWGAAGYPGADEYWPGAEHTDYVSVTLNGKSELEATAFPVVQNPEVNLRRKIQRMRMFRKPVLVLHAGTDSDTDLKTALANAAADTRRDAEYLYQVDNTATKTNVKRVGVPLVGVYDPKELLVNSGMVSVEHLFIDLENVQNGQFKKDFNAIISRQHDAIVSIEPWRDLKVRKDSNVLNNVINGIYDAEFAEIYHVLSASEQTVFLRFAHEMEIPIHRYAWQSQDPVLYIKAFRYFMNFDKSKNKHIKKIWGPAGDRGSMEWWPGSDVVDYISIAIYGLPDKNITDPEKQESFEVIYNRKAYRMRFANKPIFITEFGVKGSEDFQQKWLLKAARVINAHPEISGVSYFNLADNPKVWGDIPAPDWSVSQETFQDFVNNLSIRR